MACGRNSAFEILKFMSGHCWWKTCLLTYSVVHRVGWTLSKKIVAELLYSCSLACLFDLVVFVYLHLTWVFYVVYVSVRCRLLSLVVVLVYLFIALVLVCLFAMYVLRVYAVVVCAVLLFSCMLCSLFVCLSLVLYLC